MSFTFRPRIAWPPRNGAAIAQQLLIVLLVLNLIAAWFVWRPLGGSPSELEQQMVELRAQVLKNRVILERTRQNVSKVETGRTEGDGFMQNYFLGERTTYSNILGELMQASSQSRIKLKEHTLSVEPIEGSDDLGMMTITGNYEGTYPDLMQFINRLDRSPGLLIIDSLNATPQQGSAGLLNVNMKLDAFVRQEAPTQTGAGQ